MHHLTIVDLLIMIPFIMCMWGLSPTLVMAQQATSEASSLSTVAFSYSDSYILPSDASHCHDTTRNSEDEFIFCRQRQRLSTREYVLRHPFQSPQQLEMPQLEATVSSQNTVPHRVQQSKLSSSRIGDSILIEVGSLLDGKANVTSCVSSSRQSPEDCNYRSAVAYCQQILTEPTSYCYISLPTSKTLVMEPLFGDVILTEVIGNFYLFGNGCTFQQQESAFSTAAMQLLAITSSLTDEIHLTLTNMTVTGFKHPSGTVITGLGTILGGAFHFTSLASAQFLHVNCTDNSAGEAGCVAFTGGHNIVVEDSTFSGNYADQLGGALSFSDHTTSGRVSHCIFEGNTAKSGGAVHIGITNRNLVFQFCVFESNSGLATGGAVDLSLNNEKIEFEDCTFQFNIAVIDGGAVYLFSNNTKIKFRNGLFIDNSAAQGGALYAGERNSELGAKHCRFERNWASYGGAIYLYVNNFNADMENTNFESNRALVHGGAMCLYSNNNLGHFHVLNYTNNKANKHGGAIYIDFSNDLTWFDGGTFFTGNEAMSGSGGAVFLGCKNTGLFMSAVFSDNKAKKNGGAVALISGNILNIIRGSSFYHNTAGAGGAIHSSLENSGLFITYSDFWENSVPTTGGAVYVGDDHDNMTLSNVLVHNCRAQDGGGVYIGLLNTRITVINVTVRHNEATGIGGGLLSYAVSLRMVNSIFSNNQGGTIGGGVILAGSRSSGITIEDSYVESNNAHEYGGMIIEGHDDVMITNIIVKDNRATSSHGGGLSMRNGKGFTCQNCSVHHNSAFTYGAGLLMTSTSSVEMNDSFVMYNEAVTDGGGIHITESSDVKFASTMVNQNIAGRQGGGAYWAEVQALQLTDCDLVRNLARNESGGGVFVQSSGLHLARVNFRSNAAPFGGGGGIFWVKGSGMDEPIGLNTSTVSNNTFDRNVAVYGDNWATESSQILLNNRSTNSIDDYESKPHIIAHLYDHYDNAMSLGTDEDVVAILNPEVEAAATACGENTGYLTGAVNVQFQNGLANFSDFTAYCTPGGNLSIAVTHVITSVGRSSRFYSSFILQFRPCVRGEYYGDRVCTQCESGTYSFTTSDDNEELKQSICKPCPEHAASCEGDVIHLEAGYWRVHEDTEEILECPWGETSCQGGPMVGDDLCAPGYEGPLCAVCEDGFHFMLSTQSCEPCEKESSWLTAYSSLFVMAFIFIVCVVILYFFKSHIMDRENLNSLDDVLVYIAMRLHIIDEITYHRNKVKLSIYTKENRRRFNTRVRIYIAFYQIISVVPFVLDLDLPNLYTTVVSFLGAIVNFNVSTSTVVTCSVDSEYDFIDTLYVNITIPVVITCLLKLISMVHLHFKNKKWIRKKTSDDEMRNKSNRIRSYYFLTFLLYSYMFLPSLSAEIFQTFSCANVDEDDVAEGDDYYLRADYSVSCETARYAVAVIIASVAVVIYPVGIPSFYFYHLYSNRHLIQTRDQPCASAREEKHRLLRLRPLRILFDVYKPQFWYWEVIETIYRLCLTGVLVLINQGSSLQIIMGLLFSLVFIRLYEMSCPYEDEMLQQIKNISLWQIFFIFGCALLINGDFIDKTNVIVVVVMIFVIFLNLLVDILRWLYVVVQDNKQNVGETFSDIKRRSSSSLSSMSGRKSLMRARPTSCHQETAVISPLAELDGGEKEVWKQQGGTTDVELTSIMVDSSSDQQGKQQNGEHLINNNNK